MVGDGRGVVAEELVVEGLELEDDPALVVVVADHAGLDALVVDGDGSEIWWSRRGERKGGKIRSKFPLLIVTRTYRLQPEYRSYTGPC